MTKRIFITGIRGFIGSHLMEKLIKNGYDFFSYDIQDGLDINNYKQLEDSIIKYKPSIIIHLAAVSSRTEVDLLPNNAIVTNILGSYNIFNIAEKYNIKTLFASSAAVLEPGCSLYGMTKYCGEKIAMTLENIYIMRFYNVYGMRSYSVINKFINLIRSNQPIILNGNTFRDYIYIDDVINEIINFIKKPKPQKLVEIGTGRSISLNKLVNIISGLLNKKPIVIKNNPIQEIQYSQCNLVNKKYILLKDGIKKMI